MRGFVQNFSYENEFYLHVNENSFSYERLCSKTCFEKKRYKNSEMAYHYPMKEEQSIPKYPDDPNFLFLVLFYFFFLDRDKYM